MSSMPMARRVAAATMLAGVGTMAMAGAANATESHSPSTEHASSHHQGLVSGLVGAGGELGQGVGGLVEGVGGAVHGVLGSDTAGSLARGLL